MFDSSTYTRRVTLPFLHEKFTRVCSNQQGGIAAAALINDSLRLKSLIRGVSVGKHNLGMRFVQRQIHLIKYQSANRWYDRVFLASESKYYWPYRRAQGSPIILDCATQKPGMSSP